MSSEKTKDENLFLEIDPFHVSEIYHEIFRLDTDEVRAISRDIQIRNKETIF